MNWSVCTNSSIRPTAAFIEELELFGDGSVGGTRGGGWCGASWCVAVGLSGGVGRTDAPVFDDASAACDTDLEDIVFVCNFLLII